MDRKRLGLTDLLDLELLRILRECFASIAGGEAFLVDNAGGILLYPSGAVESADDVLPCPSCKGAIMGLCNKSRRTKAPSTAGCPQCGLYMGALPVFFDSKYLGSWIFSWVPVADINGKGTGVVLPEFEGRMKSLAGFTTALMKLARGSFRAGKSNADLLELIEKLELTAQMFAEFTNSADMGMYVTDYFTGEILQVNNQYALLRRASAEDLIGTPCWTGMNQEYTSFCDNCPRAKLLDEKGQPRKPVSWEKYMPDSDMWMRYTSQAIYWMDGRLAHMVIFEDITRMKQMRSQLAHLANYNRNMQLPNAYELMRDLKEWDDWAGGYLICFDIVGLRTINDVYGRGAGDALLGAVCDWIHSLKIRDPLLYRIGGDEFCLVLQSSEASVARLVADHIFARFEEPWIVSLKGETLRIFCSVSMGVIDYGRQLEGGEDLISLIEHILSTSRKTGKIASYDEEMAIDYKQHLKLELSLKKCIMEGMVGFEVHYQPIVDPVRGTWSALEALSRWVSPECGEVPPIVFIHKVEQLGLVGELDRWVLETAVSQCKRWGLDKHPSFILDVNVSPAQIADEETLPDDVIEILERYDYPGEKLSLEVTESTEMNFSSHTLHSFDKLREANILVALDDFGTGYSSFNNLKNLPVSILKTERAFILNIQNDTYLQYLFYVMVELAHAVGMRIIVEGVETQAQLEILLKNEPDFLQGYLFSKPLSAVDLEKQLGHFYTPDPALCALLHGKNPSEPKGAGERRQSRKPAGILSRQDTLTGVLNRPSLLERLPLLIQEADCSGTPLALCLVDLDDLRRINRQYGLAAGDRQLRLVAAVLREAVPENDAIGRIGGDQFLVVLPNCTGEAMRKRMNLAKQLLAEGGGTMAQYSFSYGIVESAEQMRAAGADPLGELIELAHNRMKAGKRINRMRVN